VTVAPLATPRSRSADELSLALLERGATVTIYPEISEALERQCDQAIEGDEIVLFGSFYCVAEALNWLERHAANGGYGRGG